MPAGERSASGIGISCDPSGISSVMQRKSGESRSTTFRQRFGLTRAPWTKTIGSPVPASKTRIRPPLTSISRGVPRAGSLQNLFSLPIDPASLVTYRVYDFACARVTYRRYVCVMERHTELTG